MTPLDEIARAEVFDEVMTWRIASRSDPHATHLVELADYSGNGSCDCTDFQMRFGALLSQRIDADQAIARGLVKWPNKERKYQVRKSDALRCAHIMEARDQACSHFIRAFDAARKKLRAP